MTVVRRDGDDAGEPIELTVFAHYSGIEFPARLELTTARLTMYLNVERYHRLFPLFKTLYPRLKDTWAQLQEANVSPGDA